MDFLKYVAKRSHLAGLALGSLLLLTSGFVFNYMSEVNSLSVLKEGISTCFGRVKNSYTAKLLGDGKSTYLNSSFMATTEECFGETLASLGASFEATLSNSEKVLNTISSDSHWFHQKLGSEEAKLVGQLVTVSNYGARFNTIESNVNKVIGGIESYQSSVQKKLVTGKILFVSFIVLSMALLAWETWRKILLFRRREDIEKRALEELNEKGGRTSSIVGTLVSEALAETRFDKTTDLFMNFHENSIFTKEQTESKNISFVTGENRQEWEAQIDKVWNRSDDEKEITTNVDKTSDITVDCSDVHIDNTLSKIVNLMSSRLFTKGIILDLDVTEDIYVKADEEALEQVFYHLFFQSLKGLEDAVGEKRIAIKLKKLGGSILVEMESNGSGFSNEFIRYETGLGSLNEAPEANATELEICKQFMADFGGKVMFENIQDPRGKVRGSRIKLLFIGVSDRKSALVDLKRGTKKEILDQLKSEASLNEV
ncbi:MAG: HAMP domain-containing histidine kinase [Bacteriovoracaceae bacterium]|nr:HAMP domain-containing histidine kinase [Bacteriovoracaceae bacterium]